MKTKKLKVINKEIQFKLTNQITCVKMKKKKMMVKKYKLLNIKKRKRNKKKKN